MDYIVFVCMCVCVNVSLCLISCFHKEKCVWLKSKCNHLETIYDIYLIYYYVFGTFFHFIFHSLIYDLWQYGLWNLKNFLCEKGRNGKLQSIEWILRHFRILALVHIVVIQLILLLLPGPLKHCNCVRKKNASSCLNTS